MKAGFVLRKNDVQKYSSKIWKMVIGLMFCIIVVITVIAGGNLTAFAAAGDSPSAIEKQFIQDEDGKTGKQTEGETEDVYTLHLVHYLRFTVNGESRNIREEETLKLTEADFEKGICDLSDFAYDAEQLTVTEAKPVSIDAFGKTHESGARIVYAVDSKYEIVPTGKGENTGTVLRGIFRGELSDYEFVPANIVTFTVNYQYSKTGGLYGVSPNALETIQAVAAKDGENYVFEVPIKSKSGFRIVLNSAPLDKYLNKQPPKNATPEELQQMLDNGDFNGDITAHEIYAYQEEQKDLEADPDYSITNKKYSNIYSTQYNQAWNEARIFEVNGIAGYSAMAVCGDTESEHSDQTDENHGANELKNPKLKIIMSGEQMENALKDGCSITVNYRRTATWYTAKHWVPKDLANLTEEQINSKEKTNVDGVDYVLIDSENLQGRAGALTRAVAKTDGEIYEKLTPRPFAQELIKGIVSITDLEKNEADEKNKPTVINIYYKAAESYRVIFDTDYAYIPRQQVSFGDSVDFSKVKAAPERKGYRFDGWQYLKKDAEPDENGKYDGEDYEDVPKQDDSYKLNIDAELFNKARFRTTDGVSSLHLYPKWTADKTNITVVLWTEDLDGLTDVQAIAEGGNVAGDKSDYYSQKYNEYGDEVTSNEPVLNNDTQANTNYSNVGSFSMEVDTDSSLVDDESDLKAGILTEVEKEFNKSAKNEEGTVDPITFYNYYGFEIMHETNGGMDFETKIANADGKTMVYVYFTRKIYTLKFHYYGRVDNEDFAVATGTCGYSYSNGACYDNNGDLIFDYKASHDIGSGGKSNMWYKAGKAVDTPHTITIKAKYGADLRNVWPVARPEESIPREGKKDVRMISWTATLGKYRDDSTDKLGSHYDEATIMGLFASMDEEIIAKPEDPEQVHHLVSYWDEKYGVSTYRYTHCYEVPGLKIDSDGINTVSLWNDSKELKDTLYLVPKNNDAFTKYGFTDLLTVDYDNNTKTVTYSEYGKDNGGEYYAVRGYETKDNDGKSVIKYYAVGRQIDTISTNAINKQNPSARAHMKKVNNVADHTTQYTDDDGRTWAGDPVVVGEDEPYALYFYYDRDRYSIKYMVPVNRSDTDETELELGHIELPYGTHVTRDGYAFELNYSDTNDNAKYGWSRTGDKPVPVCPDRSETGTKIWKFNGWGLGPAGVNMLWESDAKASGGGNKPQAQATDDFYIGSSMLIYAIWENPVCNVTFHLNGGTAATFTTNQDDMITVTVPANTKITDSDAKIPRPLYSGHTMDGWYKADENGDIQKPESEFNFDDYITEDVHVVVKWTAKTVKDYGYKIYFVTDKPKKGDSLKEKIYINDDGQITEENTAGAKEYYILNTKENKGTYVPGTTVNLKAEEIAGYIPTETNKSLTLNDENREYYIIFYYDSHTKGSYIVRYVEAGTETGTDPAVIQQNVIPDERINADKAVLTPGKEAVKTLKDKGYMLVNRNNDGKTYTQVTDYTKLKWVDTDGRSHVWSADLTDFLKEDAEKTITYLVQPIVYTIAYKNADNSPAAADDALSAITAENTSVEDAGKKNPTLYTAKDRFILKNPQRVYDGGKWYRFSHWNLGKNTTEAGQSGKTYNRLTVEKGTSGNLTFVANWIEVTEMGDLKVSNTVSGNGGDIKRLFTFTVKLSDTSVNGTYGDMTFKDGVATFKLKHGESMTAQGIPADIGYTVEESDNSGYTVSSSGETGTIENGLTAVAEFNNKKSENYHNNEPGEPTDSTKPTKPAKPTSSVEKLPGTGDEANLTLWITLAVLSGIVIIVVFAVSRLRRKR